MIRMGAPGSTSLMPACASLKKSAEGGTKIPLCAFVQRGQGIGVQLVAIPVRTLAHERSAVDNDLLQAAAIHVD